MLHYRLKTATFMRRIACLLPAVLLFAGCSHPADKQQNPTVLRIISLAPSITETIFALGCGDQVVGVSDFCKSPAAVSKIPRVGGYVDPNFEMIMSLKPNLAFLLKEHTKVKDFCRANNIRCVEIDDHNVQSIIASVRIIGKCCGKSAEGDQLADRMEREFTSADSLTGPKPRILLSVGRDGAGSGTVASIWAAGPRTFYHEIIAAAGGINVINDSSLDYPTISAEGISRLRPDIIIDAMSSMEQYAPQADKLRKDWDVLRLVPAVRDSMVRCVTGDYVTIPGPRIVDFLRDLRGIVAEWRTDKAVIGHR